MRQRLDWCRQNTFRLAYGDITFHGFMRAYSRWVPGKARIQIVMMKGSNLERDQWTIEHRYGGGQEDWFAFTYENEGACFRDFLSIVCGWEEYDNKTFIRQVKDCHKGGARKEDKGVAQT